MDNESQVAVEEKATAPNLESQLLSDLAAAEKQHGEVIQKVQELQSQLNQLTSMGLQLAGLVNYLKAKLKK
jgi:hypothetical protein